MGELLDLLSAALLGRGLGPATLLFVRLLPIVALTPLFGGRNAPQRYRIGLTVVFTVVLLPTFVPELPQVGIAEYGVLLVKEALIGLTIAVFLVVLFEMLAAAGAFIDLARGATIANVLDPSTQQQSSIASVFLLQLFLVLFFSLGGARLLLRALGESFVVAPPGRPLPPRFTAEGGVEAMAGLLGDLFVVAVQLAAPVLVVMFLLDVALGLINRVAPQIQVFFLGFTIKASIGLLVLFAVLGITFEQLIAEFLGRLLAWLVG